MANKTISDLTSSIDSKDSDVLLIEDGSTTMKITKGTLLQECSKEGHGHLISDIDTLQEALDDKLDYVILAPVATSGSYADLTDTPTIPTKVSELQNDNKYLVTVPSEYVTEQELAAELVQKSDINHIHKYKEITGVPTIPSKVSELKNDKNYVTQNELNSQLQQKSDIDHIHRYEEITEVPSIPSKVSELENDKNYVTQNKLNLQLQQKSNIDHTHRYEEITGVPTIPSKVSELENDNEYVQQSIINQLEQRILELETLVSQLVDRIEVLETPEEEPEQEEPTPIE